MQSQKTNVHEVVGDDECCYNQAPTSINDQVGDVCKFNGQIKLRDAAHSKLEIWCSLRRKPGQGGKASAKGDHPNVSRVIDDHSIDGNRRLAIKQRVATVAERWIN